jgi:hypothetical protein
LKNEDEGTYNNFHTAPRSFFSHLDSKASISLHKRHLDDTTPWWHETWSISKANAQKMTGGRWRSRQRRRGRRRKSTGARRGRQSDTMDFEECNFRRHTTIAMSAYLPRRIISSSARHGNPRSSRLGKALEVARPRRDRKTAFFSISGNFNELRIPDRHSTQQWLLYPAAHETPKSNNMHFLFQNIQNGK